MKTLKILSLLCVIFLASSCKQNDWLDWKTQNELWLIENAKRDGYVETLLHRRRYLPDINSRNANVRGYAERNAVNAPIQGTAADIIKIAMVKIADRLKREGLKAEMLLQVHDELNFNVPVNEVDVVRKIVVDEMQNVVQLTVPLIADCGVGKNWLEAH